MSKKLLSYKKYNIEAQKTTFSNPQMQCGCYVGMLKLQNCDKTTSNTHIPRQHVQCKAHEPSVSKLNFDAIITFFNYDSKKIDHDAKSLQIFGTTLTQSGLVDRENAHLLKAKKKMQENLT